MSAAPALILYSYKNCDTCRRAAKWLAARGAAFEERPIRETPPSVTELAAVLQALGGERRKLCNTSGTDYRAEKFGDVFPALDEPTFLTRLAANGNLVKRPVLLRKESEAGVYALALAGFDETVWATALDEC